MKSKNAVIIIIIIFLILNVIGCAEKSIELQAYTVDQSGEENIAYLDDLLIDCNYMDINLIKTDNPNLTYDLYGKISLDQEEVDINNFVQIKSNVNKDKLIIAVDKDISIKEYNNKSSLTLDIYIPASYSNDISIISSDSNIKISNIIVDTLEIESSKSSIEIENTIASRFNGVADDTIIIARKLDTIKSSIEMTKGGVNFKNYKGNIEINSRESDINIEYDDYSNKVEVWNGKGSVNISLPESSDFYLDARAKDGYVRSEFPIPENEVSSKEGLKGIFKSDKNSIFVSNGTGNVKIKKFVK